MVKYLPAQNICAQEAGGDCTIWANSLQPWPAEYQYANQISFTVFVHPLFSHFVIFKYLFVARYFAGSGYLCTAGRWELHYLGQFSPTLWQQNTNMAIKSIPLHPFVSLIIFQIYLLPQNIFGEIFAGSEYLCTAGRWGLHYLGQFSQTLADKIPICQSNLFHCICASVCFTSHYFQILICGKIFCRLRIFVHIRHVEIALSPNPLQNWPAEYQYANQIYSIVAFLHPFVSHHVSIDNISKEALTPLSFTEIMSKKSSSLCRFV